MITSLINRLHLLGALACLTIISTNATGQERSISNTIHHLRNAGPKEWATFPESDMTDLSITFQSTKNATPQTLIFRQQDVKQSWKISLNDQPIGSLTEDERDMQLYIDIPKGILKDGENRLHIYTTSKIPDDIRVGPISINTMPRDQILAQASIDITVVDKVHETQLPSRITITNKNGVLQTVSSQATNTLAIRPGCVYTADGKASLTLPAGTYTFYAGRGFEYGIDSATLTLKPGDHLQQTFSISREVDTRGWISCDTHIHTHTHSGHGDASDEDRVITLAGEGIELPVITDHNVNIDLSAVAKNKQVNKYFTLVTGDELTTQVGHFNIFRTDPKKTPVDSHVENWTTLSENVKKVNGSAVVILNHARDVHNNFRPFDPNHHLSSVGISTTGWAFPANAMELINSGSQQSDRYALYRDWFGMLNHGYFLVPVGSSDSHDVSRYTVGQGRTYIRTKDDDPSKINLDTALQNLKDGNVLVSLGLLTTLKINGNEEPGALVPAADVVTVAVSVSAPSWINATRVMLYANGIKIREQPINPSNVPGVKWKGSWEIKMWGQDVYLVAIAEGPGNGMPFWPIAKPFQPTTTDWSPYVIGSTGAVWVDSDKNGKRTSANDYAVDIWNTTGGNVALVMKKLERFDQAVVTQVAALYWQAGKLSSPELQRALKSASPVIQQGFSVVRQEVAMLQR